VWKGFLCHGGNMKAAAAQPHLRLPNANLKADGDDCRAWASHQKKSIIAIASMQNWRDENPT
jgi:hypothetical protein